VADAKNENEQPIVLDFADEPARWESQSPQPLNRRLRHPVNQPIREQRQ